MLFKPMILKLQVLLMKTAESQRWNIKKASILIKIIDRTHKWSGKSDGWLDIVKFDFQNINISNYLD